MYQKNQWVNQPNINDYSSCANIYEPNQSMIYPNVQVERLIFEIKENRRRINNLAKRIVRLENYLRIKDDLTNPIEDDFHNPGNYSF